MKASLTRYAARCTTLGLMMFKSGYAEKGSVYATLHDLERAIARHPGGVTMQRLELIETVETVAGGLNAMVAGDRFAFRLNDPSCWALQSKGGGLVSHFGPDIYTVKTLSKARAYQASYPSTHTFLTVAEIVPVRLTTEIRLLKP